MEIKHGQKIKTIKGIKVVAGDVLDDVLRDDFQVEMNPAKHACRKGIAVSSLEWQDGAMR